MPERYQEGTGDLRKAGPPGLTLMETLRLLQQAGAEIGAQGQRAAQFLGNTAPAQPGAREVFSGLMGQATMVPEVLGKVSGHFADQGFTPKAAVRSLGEVFGVTEPAIQATEGQGWVQKLKGAVPLVTTAIMGTVLGRGPRDPKRVPVPGKSYPTAKLHPMSEKFYPSTYAAMRDIDAKARTLTDAFIATRRAEGKAVLPDHVRIIREAYVGRLRAGDVIRTPGQQALSTGTPNIASSEGLVSMRDRFFRVKDPNERIVASALDELIDPRVVQARQTIDHEIRKASGTPTPWEKRVGMAARPAMGGPALPEATENLRFIRPDEEVHLQWDVDSALEPLTDALNEFGVVDGKMRTELDLVNTLLVNGMLTAKRAPGGVISVTFPRGRMDAGMQRGLLRFKRAMSIVMEKMTPERMAYRLERQRATRPRANVLADKRALASIEKEVADMDAAKAAGKPIDEKKYAAWKTYIEKKGPAIRALEVPAEEGPKFRGKVGAKELTVQKKKAKKVGAFGEDTGQLERFHEGSNELERLIQEQEADDNLDQRVDWTDALEGDID